MKNTQSHQKVIGLDLDNTFGDFTDALRQFVAKSSKFTPEQTQAYLPEPNGYSMENWHWDKTVFSGFLGAFKMAERNGGLYSNMAAFDGATESIRHIRNRFDASIHVVTARSDLFAEETQSALKTWGIHDIVDKVTFTNTKHVYPADVFIDDAPSHLESFSERGIPAVAFHQLYNVESPAKARISTWRDSVQAIGTALGASM